MYKLGVFRKLVAEAVPPRIVHAPRCTSFPRAIQPSLANANVEQWTPQVRTTTGLAAIDTPSPQLFSTSPDPNSRSHHCASATTLGRPSHRSKCSLASAPSKTATMPLPATWFLLLSYFLSLVSSATSEFSVLTDDHLRSIPSPGDDFNIEKGALLAPILIPRVPGTEGNRKVQKHFVDFFADNLPEWKALSQNSTSKTPVTGDEDVPFSNWIFRRDPPWAREGDVGRLTLVAHFDSLIKPEGFIGAIDSAAPCAMLLHVARSIDAALTAKWKEMEANGDDGLEEAKGIQIIFLDGEEAFEKWSDTDSIYGARYAGLPKQGKELLTNP